MSTAINIIKNMKSCNFSWCVGGCLGKMAFLKVAIPLLDSRKQKIYLYKCLHKNFASRTLLLVEKFWKGAQLSINGKLDEQMKYYSAI